MLLYLASLIENCLDKMNKKICFVGGGNMAEAMIAGLISKNYDSRLISVVDRNQDKLSALKDNYDVMTYQSYRSIISDSDVIILAIKPQQMGSLITEIKTYIKDQLIITVAAGIEVKVYESLFAKQVAFARVMPNTPASLGYGATGVYFNRNVSASQQDVAESILQTMGIVEVVDDEYKVDIVAACSGSGPAYFFAFMEYLVSATTKKGLDSEQAKRLVIQTCLGAAKMAQASNQSIATLRQNVTSKKGITAEALNVFEKSDLVGIVENAIDVNISKAKEISRDLRKSFL
jgi:pyrroline-5-carboxylate reductase